MFNKSYEVHMTPLVINSLGRGHTRTRIPTIHTGSILRNQACAGLWPARAWFKNTILLNTTFICSSSRAIYISNIINTNIMLKHAHQAYMHNLMRFNMSFLTLTQQMSLNCLLVPFVQLFRC